MRSPNRIHLILPNTSLSKSVANAAIAALVAQAHPTQDEMNDVKTALSEAITNCVLHAYPNEKNGTIYVTATLQDRELTIFVRDRGIGIEDVERAKIPLFTTLPDIGTGMGFTIMESLMDKVTVTSTPGKGTKITLKRKFRGI